VGVSPAVVPHGRREDTWFHDWAQTHAPTWQEARRAPGSRLGDPDRVWRTFEAPAPVVDGYSGDLGALQHQSRP